MSYRAKDATPATASVHQEAEAQYPMEDRHDFADARRGLVAPIPNGQVLRADGEVIFDLADYAYISEDAPRPETVDASLWRASQVMVHDAGLYKVVDHLYQVRNNDLGNLTIVEGDDGLVIIDCTTGVEAAAQGMALFREHVADKPVAAVIYTHTHVDHYGGVRGVVDPDDVASGKVPIIAPGTVASFDKYAIAENVIVGTAVSRRAMYAFGNLLDRDPKQFVTLGAAIGNGKGFTISYLSPTDPITETGQVRTIAGLTFEFLYTPDTEAPEEMHIWIPELKALTCAENANHCLHNIQTLRGARTRDASNFARYLDETLERWGDQAEVHFGPHSWPVWGNENIVRFIEDQRDMYKYIHDQALRLANKGYTPLEAAEVIELPPELANKWYNRQYHGTVHHDVRGVFTKELGMWDGDPVSLHPHIPVETAKRYVDLIGAEAILAEGKRAFGEGDYRWVAQILHHLVFAQPDNQDAKDLQADAYEQMGYQTEAPQWRGIFLTAARELREGNLEATFTTASPDTIAAMPLDVLFAFAGVHVIGDKAVDTDLRIDFAFTDMDQTWTVWVKRGVLNARLGASPETHLTVSGPKAALTGVVLKPDGAHELAEAGRIQLDGDTSVLQAYADVMDQFEINFNIVTP